MRSIFDDVIEATEAANRAPVVVSAAHDVNAIAVEEAAIRAAVGAAAGVRGGVLGGWDAAEYGITAAAAQAAIDAADTPEARARVMADLRTRAITRASLDTTGGRVAVMVVGQPAWHRLGVNVSAAVNAAQAIGLAGLDWQVSKRPMSFRRADGTYVESEETFAIVRDDSQDQLGTVGSRYKPIQNADGFAFLDSVIGEFGARFHTAGAIYGGRQVWMQCELPSHGFEVTRGDEVQAFATFSNPHDGSGRAWCYPTTNRVVCANTFRTASRDRSKGLGIRHTGDVRSAITDARAALGLAVREIDRFKDATATMVNTPVDAPRFFDDLLDATLDITAAEARMGSDALAAVLAVTTAERDLAAKRIQRQIDHRSATLDDILDRYHSDRCGANGMRGTQWAAFNAVTEHADHTGPRRRVGTEADRLSRRFESVINGDADDLKQTAFEMLTQTLAAR